MNNPSSRPNQDFIMLPKTGELENKGLQGKIEYFVTLDMAKQLAMVENNEKGMLVSFIRS